MQVVKADFTRYPVRNGYDWSRTAGTDFLAVFGPESTDTTAGNANNLAEAGWTTTSVALTAGSAADFNTSADVGIPPHALLADASDVLASPQMFGDYSHTLLASKLLGFQPTALNMEVYAAFTTASNNETATGFGFVEAGGSILTANDALAVIVSNGTNFVCRSGADSDAGAAVDTAWHLWRIRITPGTTDKVQWFIDDVSQGTLDLETDLFPVAWAGGVQAVGANDVAIAWTRIWYD